MSSQPYAYTLKPIAYALPILHAARYTAQTVLGVFLGTVDESSRQVIIEDAIPLLHHYTSLSPIAEAGLTLIQADASKRSLKLVGMYVAHDGEVSGLGRVGDRILDGLRTGFEGVVGMTIDSSRLGSGEFPYTVFAGSPSKAVPATSASLPVSVKLQLPSIVQETLTMIRRKGVHREVVDFDDHVENADTQWPGNEPVKALIRQNSGEK